MKDLETKIFKKSTIEKYDKKIKSLGSYSKISVTNFLVSRLFIEIILFIALLLIPKYGLLIAIIVTLIFHFLYEYLLIDESIKYRDNYIYDEALIFFTKLKLSIIKTNDLKKSLEVLLKNDNSLFVKDLRKSFNKNKYNNDLSLIFNDMLKRINNQDIIVSLIDLKETNNYLPTIDKIINELEEKDILLSREKYKKIPFTLSIVSISFIVIFALIIIFLPNILSILF